mgnify:CR=1 FL=1
MRKLNGDKQLSDKHVVPLLDHFVLDEDGLAFVETDERLHGEAIWTHLLSMPQAERDLTQGLVGYLSVLEAQRRAFNSRNAIIALRNQRLLNRIDLYLALGGDFR